LFVGGALIAERWTERDGPHPFYEVDRVMHDVTSVARALDADGRGAFDVTLRARPSTQRGAAHHPELGSALS
jgi:hypothetical protein